MRWAGDELSSLDKFGEFSELETLDIARARFATDKLIGPLMKLTKLKRLNVSDTQITANGLKRLRDALPHCTVTAERYSGLPNTGLPSRGGQAFKTDDDLNTLKGRDDLRTITLGSDVTDAGLVNLRGLTGLTSLNLSRTKVSDEGLANIAGLTQLQELFLSNANVSDKGLAHLSRLRQLRTLSLSKTQVTDAGFTHLADSTRLSKLYLGGTRVKGKGLTSLKGLQELYVTGSTLNDLLFLAELSELRIASLKGAQVTGPAMEGLSRLKELRTLNLQTARLDAAAVQKLNRMVRVEHLALDHTNITDEALPQLANLTQLRFLALDHNQISDAGLEYLVSLSNLDRLDLGSTNVTAEGIRKLQEALPDCQIRR